MTPASTTSLSFLSSLEIRHSCERNRDHVANGPDRHHSTAWPLADMDHASKAVSAGHDAATISLADLHTDMLHYILSTINADLRANDDFQALGTAACVSVAWSHAARANAHSQLVTMARDDDGSPRKYLSIPSLMPYVCSMVGAMATAVCQDHDGPNPVSTVTQLARTFRGSETALILSSFKDKCTAVRENWQISDAAAAVLHLLFGSLRSDPTQWGELMRIRESGREWGREWDHYPATEARKIMELIDCQWSSRRADMYREVDLCCETPSIALCDVQRALRIRLAAYDCAVLDCASCYDRGNTRVGMRTLHLHTDDPEIPTLIRRYFNYPNAFSIAERMAACVQDLGHDRTEQVRNAFEWAEKQKAEDHPMVELESELEDDSDDDDSEPGEEYDSNYDSDDEDDENEGEGEAEGGGEGEEQEAVKKRKVRPWEADLGGGVIPLTERKQHFDKIIVKFEQALKGSGVVVTSDDFPALYTAVYSVCTPEHAQEPPGLYAYNAFCKLVENAYKSTYTPAQRQEWARFIMAAFTYLDKVCMGRLIAMGYARPLEEVVFAAFVTE